VSASGFAAPTVANHCLDGWERLRRIFQNCRALVKVFGAAAQRAVRIAPGT
jgi:hypothetical protein